MNKEIKSVEINSVPDLEDTGDIISELHKMIIEDFPDLFGDIEVTDQAETDTVTNEQPSER